MVKIAPSATVESKAQLADGVEIGPGCYVGPEVTIGPGCRLQANVTIVGNTQIGGGNVFYPSAVIGAAPQDLKYQGSPTRLIIGDNNIFREGVTVHTGTEIGGGITEVGSQNQFQVGTHLGHDVHVGNHCILSNCVQIAGHVHIEDHVTISGLAGVHQFVTLGQFCFLAGATRCAVDTPPFVICGGYEGVVMGANYRGLGRWGFDQKAIQQIRDLIRRLFPKTHQETPHISFRSLYRLLPFRRVDEAERSNLQSRIKDVESSGPLNEHCQYLIDFLKRSLYQGIHGRYLESQRRDSSTPRPSFYAAGASR